MAGKQVRKSKSPMSNNHQTKLSSAPPLITNDIVEEAIGSKVHVKTRNPVCLNSDTSSKEMTSFMNLNFERDLSRSGQRIEQNYRNFYQPIKSLED